MDSQLGYDKYDISKKQTSNSRNGEFEPKILPKYQRDINGFEDKIMALYPARMTIRDISEQVK